MDLVRYSVDQHGVATLTLDSPATRNALSDELLDDLHAGLVRAQEDDRARVVVLSSSHPHVVSAGGDLKAFAGEVAPLEKYLGLERFPRLFAAIGGLGKPVICAAGGDVLAGAFGLALACDLVIAREGVRFGCPEINVGVFPFMISALIYRSVPRVRAHQLMLLGDTIDAREAERLDIVNAVAPAEEFDTVVVTWARRLAAKSPLLMRLGKDALYATRDMSIDSATAALRAQLALALTSDDIKEGVDAFLGKRAPVWRGR
jgi:enoyl-CoA hydratase